MDSRAHDEALGRLRAFVVFLVVLHHSLLGYFPEVPAPERFAGGAMLWRIFPVLDEARWAAVPLLTALTDTFFMALMFLLSGLFVSASVARGGLPRFLRERTLRLGIPFLFCAGVVVPLAYATAYLQAGGTPDLASYARAWREIGYWPTGPAWFVLLLLLFDGLAVALFALLPGWAERIGRVAAGARERPARFFGVVVAASFLAYAPLTLAWGPEHWTHLGPLQFQTSRVLLYFVYFAIGVGLGAAGRRTSLLAGDGALQRRWRGWLLAMLGAYLPATTVAFAIVVTQGATRQGMVALGAVTFPVSCAASCFALLALFVRFGDRPSALWRSAEGNAYGIYLLHYAVVAWCQYALLAFALPGAAKALLVTAAAYLLSWAAGALLRRSPLVARLV